MPDQGKHRWNRSDRGPLDITLSLVILVVVCSAISRAALGRSSTRNQGSVRGPRAARRALLEEGGTQAASRPHDSGENSHDPMRELARPRGSADMTTTVTGPAEILALAGADLGHTAWLEITQDRVDTLLTRRATTSGSMWTSSARRRYRCMARSRTDT
jgi:hypothetical protein